MATRYQNVSYGSHPRQVVDLYEPSNFDAVTEKGPNIKGVVLYLHGGGWSGGSKDEIETVTGCNYVSDLGYYVISANYRLVGSIDGGGGEYPNNVTDVAELYKWMTFPNYAPASNPFKATWDLTVRYTGTYGLLVIGGSAGGHLAVAGGFQGAGNTGQWPRAIVSFVAPMDIAYSDSNPLNPLGKSIVDAYTLNNETVRKLASPYYRRQQSTDPDGIGYENYFNLQLYNTIYDPGKQFRLGFWYNTNDTLVPPNTIEPFLNWAKSKWGDFVKSFRVTEGAPILEGHNITSRIEDIVPLFTTFAFYHGLVHPRQQKLRPTQGMIYPRPYIYRYPK